MKAWLRLLVLTFLWKGAQRKIAKEKPYVLAITGSVGKTSAKEAIAQVLAASRRPLLKTAGNLSTDMGVPLSLLGFEEQPSGFLEWLSALLISFSPPRLKSKKPGSPYYILEFSADKPGDIAYLAKQIPFAVGILTTIVPVHMQNYRNFAELQQEKLSLFTGLKPKGYAVLNHDDPVQVAFSPSSSHINWYGIGAPPKKAQGVWASDIKLSEQGLSCELQFLKTKGSDSISNQTMQKMRLETSLLGTHQLYPLLAAAAVGQAENIPYEKIKKSLESYQVPAGRGRLIEGQRDTLIIDESYNASPESVKAGLSSLPAIVGKRRIVAILGRMNELGESSVQAHQEVAAHAAALVDYLVVIGEYGESMLEAASEAGLASDRMIAFSTPEQLMDKLGQVVQSRDVVYIKASQNGMRLERVVKKLMAHPEQAEHLLVRQSAFWKKTI